jgi:hypothetical protein
VNDPKEARAVPAQVLTAVEVVRHRGHIFEGALIIDDLGLSTGPCLNCGKRFEHVLAIPVEDCPAASGQ